MKTRFFKITNHVKWQDWCDKLNTEFRKEALQTLQEEDGNLEMFLNFQINNEWYCLALSDANLPPNIDNSLNKQHMAIKKECLVPTSIKSQILVLNSL